MTKPFDPTKPVQQKCGREAGILATDGAPPYVLLGWVRHEDGTKRQERWTAKGEAMKGEFRDRDLVNVPEEHMFYVNIYRDHEITGPFSNRAQADVLADTDRIACVRVPYQDQQFDE